MTDCAVILAGGQANRMGGGDKGRLMLGDQSLIQRVIDRITPQVDAVVLNANGNLSRFEDLGLPIVADSIEGFPRARPPAAPGNPRWNRPLWANPGIWLSGWLNMTP